MADVSPTYGGDALGADSRMSFWWKGPGILVRRHREGQSFAYRWRDCASRRLVGHGAVDGGRQAGALSRVYRLRSICQGGGATATPKPPITAADAM
ncbi:MAG: hypothetical protein ACLQOO_34415 [Terriglobia bacterium]